MTSVRPSRIAQVAIPIHDLERAKAFYGERLGLTHLFDAPPGLSFFQCGETRLMLSQPEGPETAGSSISIMPWKAHVKPRRCWSRPERSSSTTRAASPGSATGYLARRLPRQRGQSPRPDERGMRSAAAPVAAGGRRTRLYRHSDTECPPCARSAWGGGPRNAVEGPEFEKRPLHHPSGGPLHRLRRQGGNAGVCRDRRESLGLMSEELSDAHRLRPAGGG